VVGATPSRESNDPITLGTLISDEFLATFSLGAVDVAKVAVGQKVLVTITSFPDVPPLTAAITEISSLPDSSGVAQYEVQALIALPASSTIELREGLLADIEVVQEEVTDVLRVPSSAVTYAQGQATVEVLDSLTPQQQQQVDRLGIIRSETGSLPSYAVPVTVGVTGAFYVEITDGLSEDIYVVTSQDEPQTAGAVVEQQSFGGRPNNGGGGRPQ